MHIIVCLLLCPSTCVRSCQSPGPQLCYEQQLIVFSTLQFRQSNITHVMLVGHQWKPNLTRTRTTGGACKAASASRTRTGAQWTRRRAAEGERATSSLTLRPPQLQHQPLAHMNKTGGKTIPTCWSLLDPPRLACTPGMMPSPAPMMRTGSLDRSLQPQAGAALQRCSAKSAVGGATQKKTARSSTVTSVLCMGTAP